MATSTEPQPRTGADHPTATPDQRARLRRLTRVAGVLYLAIFLLYPLSTTVRSLLVVPGTLRRRPPTSPPARACSAGAWPAKPPSSSSRSPWQVCCTHSCGR